MAKSRTCSRGYLHNSIAEAIKCNKTPAKYHKNTGENIEQKNTQKIEDELSNVQDQSELQMVQKKPNFSEEQSKEIVYVEGVQEK